MRDRRFGFGMEYKTMIDQILGMIELKERDKRDAAYPLKFDGRIGSQGVQHERVAKDQNMGCSVHLEISRPSFREMK